MLLFQCHIEFTEGALRAIAQAALEKLTGARGLRSEVVCGEVSLILTNIAESPSKAAPVDKLINPFKIVFVFSI